MGRFEYTLLDVEDDQLVFGLWQKSSDKRQSKDIPALTERYYGIVSKGRSEVLPFFVLSKGYDEGTGEFDLFVGGKLENDALEQFTIPRGVYAKATVRPKMGLLWGLSIGQVKRDFYTVWLRGSGYAAVNMEYEHHTEASIGKKPQIDILFAVKELPL